MANTVAGLVVSLGLNATEYYQGLTKAEYQAKKFSQSFSSGMGSLKSVLGGLGIGLVVNEIYDLGKSVISTAANLNDFADQTGSSVENLSKLSNQAAIAGTSFEELQGATLKLAVGMGSAGEKGEKVDRILKTLGVTAKDPAEALQQIAVSFAKYEDGATKAAYAQELFGKSGAKFLATLKDISNLQDVAATTTKKQAEEAEKLEQAYRRIGAEATLFKNAILSNVVPALLRVITEFNAAREAGLGFWQSLSLIGSGQTSIDERIETTTKALEAAQKALETGKHPGALITNPFYNFAKDVEKYRKELEALQNIKFAGSQQNAARGNDVLAQLPKLPGASGRAARTPTERISDAQRYLESLQQQLQKTKELTAVEKLWDDIGAGRLKLNASESVDQLRRLAEQVDAANALKEAEKERLKLAADEARIREQTSNMRQRSLDAAQSETAALAQQNQQMLQEIALIGKDATSIAQMEQARLDDAIAAKQQALAMRINADAYDDEAKAIEDQIRLLQARKGILIQRGVAEQMAADVAKAKEINDLFVNSFAEGASSVIRNAKSIGDAIKGMGRSIADALTNLAAKNIANSLFGAATSSGGGGIFAGIGTMISGLFGGGMSGGGPVAANQAYVVGERGPELFMPKTAGTIIPNSQTGRGNFVFNINVPAGASRSTIEQTRLKFGMELQNVMDRHG